MITKKSSKPKEVLLVTKNLPNPRKDLKNLPNPRKDLQKPEETLGNEKTSKPKGRPLVTKNLTNPRKDLY